MPCVRVCVCTPTPTHTQRCFQKFLFNKHTKRDLFPLSQSAENNVCAAAATTIKDGDDRGARRRRDNAAAQRTRTRGKRAWSAFVRGAVRRACCRGRNSQPRGPFRVAVAAGRRTGAAVSVADVPKRPCARVGPRRRAAARVSERRRRSAHGVGRPRNFAGRFHVTGAVQRRQRCAHVPPCAGVCSALERDCCQRVVLRRRLFAVQRRRRVRKVRRKESVFGVGARNRPRRARRVSHKHHRVRRVRCRRRCARGDHISRAVCRRARALRRCRASACVQRDRMLRPARRRACCVRAARPGRGVRAHIRRRRRRRQPHRRALLGGRRMRCRRCSPRNRRFLRRDRSLCVPLAPRPLRSRLPPPLEDPSSGAVYQKLMKDWKEGGLFLFAAVLFAATAAEGQPLTIASARVGTAADGRGIRVAGSGIDASLSVHSVGSAAACAVAAVLSSAAADVDCADLPPGAGAVAWDVVASSNATPAATTFPGVFSFEDPAVLSLSPATVDTGGGALTVGGRNFGPSDAWLSGVSAGGVPWQCNVSVPHTAIACDVPAGVGTSYSVVVTVFGGAFSAPSVFFRYNAPSLRSAHGPATGDASSAASVRVDGANFGALPAKAAFSLNGRACAVAAVNHTVADLACDGVVGVGRVNWTVAVSVAGQSASRACFDFDDPSLLSVSPSQVPASGAPVALTILGDNFGPADGVCSAALGGVECSNCVVLDATTASCSVTAFSGAVSSGIPAELSFSLGGVSLVLHDAARWVIQEASSETAVVPQQESYGWVAAVIIVGAVLLSAATDGIAAMVLVARKRRLKQVYQKRHKPGGSTLTSSSRARHEFTVVDVETGTEEHYIGLSALSTKSSTDTGSTGTWSMSSRNVSTGGVRLGSLQNASSRAWGRLHPEQSSVSSTSTASRMSTQGRVWSSSRRLSTKPASAAPPSRRLSEHARLRLRPEVSFVMPSPGSSGTPEVSPPLDETVFDPNNAAAVPISEFPLRIAPEQLTFGLGNRQAPVCTELSETIVLTNPERLKMHFRFYFEENPKWKITFEPESYTIKPESSKSVKIKLVLDCTSLFEIPVRLVVSPGGAAQYNDLDMEHSALDWQVTIESQLTTRLDSDEVALHTPPIGNGAFGSVYRGKWRGQEVAVKVVKNQEELEGCRQHVQDFENEVAMMEKLRHPAIVGFLGAVHIPLRLAILTEFAPFGNLDSCIQKYELPFAFKLRALINCCQAMTFLHSCGILHRDLKPANLLVFSLQSSVPIVAKVSDFGTTRDLNQQTGWKEGLTVGVGTPTFMSPEVLQSGEYTMSADVYSFSIMMLQVYIEHDPYDLPEFSSPWKIAEFVTSGKRLQMPKKCPADFWALISASWSQNPSERPAFETIMRKLEDMGAELFSKPHIAKEKVRSSLRSASKRKLV